MKKYSVAYRRKREDITHYKKRLKLLLTKKHRLVVRKSLNNIYGQIIDYSAKGDRIIVSACSKELEKIGWSYHKGNIPSAYLTGLLVGKKALEKNIIEGVFDIGLYASVKGARIYAFLQGAVDAGLKVNCEKGIMPNADRIHGKHITDFGKIVNENKQKYQNQFSEYSKKGADLTKISDKLEEMKNRIMGGKIGK